MNFNEKLDQQEVNVYKNKNSSAQTKKRNKPLIDSEISSASSSNSFSVKEFPMARFWFVPCGMHSHNSTQLRNGFWG